MVIKEALTLAKVRKDVAARELELTPIREEWKPALDVAEEVSSLIDEGLRTKGILPDDTWEEPIKGVRTRSVVIKRAYRKGWREITVNESVDARNDNRTAYRVDNVILWIDGNNRASPFATINYNSAPTELRPVTVIDEDGEDTQELSVSFPVEPMVYIRGDSAFSKLMGWGKGPIVTARGSASLEMGIEALGFVRDEVKQAFKGSRSRETEVNYIIH